MSPYSVQMRENKDQKNPNTDTFHAVYCLHLLHYTSRLGKCQLYRSVNGPLTHFMLLVSFDTKGFLMFSGGIERDQWPKIC